VEKEGTGRKICSRSFQRALTRPIWCSDWSRDRLRGQKREGKSARVTHLVEDGDGEDGNERRRGGYQTKV